MKLFEGKSKAERNKIIAAIGLGILAIVAIGYNLIGFLPSKTATTGKATPTPTATRSNNPDQVVSELPPQEVINQVFSTIPVVYPLVSLGAPDAGRNIFAFYEPPNPTPWSPTPTPEVIVKTPTPVVTPTPPQFILGFSPATVYSGTGGFTLNVDGTGFTPDTRIFINNAEMPTRFVGPQRVSTDVPSNLVAGTSIQVFTRTPDGKIYSLPTFFNFQQAPRPSVQFVGIVAPKLGNNVTAYLQEGTAAPQPKRLDDRVGTCAGNSPGCFRVISIARERVILQDVALGFKYTIEIVKPAGTTSGPSTSQPQFNPNDPRFQPGFQNPPQPNSTCPPGIPCDTIPRYQPTPLKKDVDDNKDDDGDN